MNKSSQSKFDGIRALVDMFSEMDSERRQKLLEKVRERDPDLFSKIDSELMTFERILSQQKQVLTFIVQEIPISSWALALRGVDKAAQATLFSSMTERKSREIKEEMDLLGPQAMRKVLEARKEIVRVARELERLQKLSLE